MAFPFDQLLGLFRRTRSAPPVAKRAYKAASPKPRDMRDAWQGPINNELSAAKARMDGRARFLYPNDPSATAAVEAWVSTLIGAGVIPRFQGRGAERLHRLWHTWGRQADADGRCDIYGLQALTFRQVIVTGEGFLLKVYRNGLLQWRLIPSAMVPTDKTQTVPGGGRIVQGVEFDANNQRVAYHIHKHQPGEVMGLPSETVRVPARDVLHVFVPLEAGQVRGVTWFAPVIAKLHELGAIEEAELMRMKVQALFGGFVTAPASEGSPFENSYEEPAPPGEEELGVIDHLEPGTLYKLRMGEDIRFPNLGTNPDGDRVALAARRAIAAGLRVPYHVLTGDVSNANYSSIRTALIEWRKHIETIQWTVLVPQMLDPMWRAFVDHMVLTGQVKPTAGID